jgi:proton glutamate symport protein
MPEPLPGRSRAMRMTVFAGGFLYLASLLTHREIYHWPLGATLRWIALALLLAPVLRRRSLSYWTFFAMLLGGELGVDARWAAVHLEVLASIFLRLISVAVAPLIFGTLTTGIAAHANLRKLGRVALKTLLYFEAITTLGLLIGMAAINLSLAGKGVASSSAAAATAAIPAHPSGGNLILNIFPENLGLAVAQNQILQIAVFSLLFGVAMALLPAPKRDPLLAVLESFTAAIFQYARIIMYLAPVAAGAAMAYSIGTTGLVTLTALAKLVATTYAALAFLAVCVMLPVLLAARIPAKAFLRAISEPAAIAFATSTSEAALPVALDAMERFGVPRWIVSFVIPTGYSFNMGGTSVYLAIAAIFAAQASGIHLSLAQQAIAFFTLMLTSKGVAGVPRAVLVILLGTLPSLHIPTAPILLMLGVDALMDMGRTAMNVIGNCLASAVIARWEGELAVLPTSAPNERA